MDDIYWLRRFSFPSPNIGYCVGDGHAVYKTYNGGKNWLQLSGFSNPNLTDVCFISQDTGYICGIGGYVAVSTDGGYTWRQINTPTNLNLQGLYIIDYQKIYVVDKNGMILKSVNAGQSWTTETSGTTSLLLNVFFLKSGKGFIVGQNGTILVNKTCTKAMFNDTIENQAIYFQDESACANSFWWDFGDGYNSSLQNPWHSYDIPGHYLVCLTVTDTLTQSSDKYCKQILVTEVNEIVLNPAISVYPNPCSDYITLKSTGNHSISRLMMYDSKGMLVLQKEFKQSRDTIYKCNFSLSQGLYILVVMLDTGKVLTEKVVVSL